MDSITPHTHNGVDSPLINKTANNIAAAVTDATISTSDITTNNVTSTKHGFAPKSPADATQFLNGAATPAYAAVKDSDLSTTDITTNNVSTTKHGFAPKLPNDATKFLDGTGAYSVPAAGTKIYNDVSTQSITNNQTLTNLYSFTLNAGTFGTNNAIIGELYIDNCRKGTATLFNLIIKYGATEVFNIPITFGAAQGGVVRFVIVGNGATNAQAGWVIWHTRVNATTSTTTNEEHIYYFSAGTAAIDSTANQTLLITGQFTGATTANDTFSSKGLTIYKIA